ncbi:hypothetical protein BJ085DRAFT_35397 [Dimargaris cristalligena]|uniref:Uncharacterized protein n=1 Tax=Dimargaris cristalligena TaxID=215637 RepID=A0A4P9ZX44_9FUNG|nr:hypothetical protein BJ085DRAFT_35397 [Dimargaris cristalligena]|eukprot:RKP38246.1 hypothetical protein BJ085DRAFT_35397 [Dimargaris cristalligena]
MRAIPTVLLCLYLAAHSGTQARPTPGFLGAQNDPDSQAPLLSAQPNPYYQSTSHSDNNNRMEHCTIDMSGLDEKEAAGLAGSSEKHVDAYDDKAYNDADTISNWSGGESLRRFPLVEDDDDQEPTPRGITYQDCVNGVVDAACVIAGAATLNTLVNLVQNDFETHGL